MNTEFQTVAGHLEKLERLFSTVTRKPCSECGSEFDALGIVVVCPACEMLPAKRESEALPLPPCWPRRHVSRLGEMVGPSLAMAEKLAPKLVGGRLCVLAGQRGTGKTQIAAFTADWRARNGYRPGLYTRAFDLCASVVGFDREAKLEKLQKTPFLVIDELHRMEAKDLPLIESVVDDRYGNDRATLCIGNWISLDGLHLGETVDGEKLTGLGSSLFSRIQEHQRDRTGGVVWCKWQSYRTSMAAELKENVL